MNVLILYSIFLAGIGRIRNKVLSLEQDEKWKDTFSQYHAFSEGCEGEDVNMYL